MRLSFIGYCVDFNMTPPARSFRLPGSPSSSDTCSGDVPVVSEHLNVLALVPLRAVRQGTSVGEGPMFRCRSVALACLLMLAPFALHAAQESGPQASKAAQRVLLAHTGEGGQQVAQADATALQEVRIYGTLEKDIGFAPAEAETAGKVPAPLLKTPQSVSVVTREQMESRQVNNLQQALQTVAGVNPVNFGRRGFDDLFMRGFRVTESILIDGLVQSPGMWTRLQSYGYERFEVLKGANSVMYGQMQPGGLINAISKRPRRERGGEVQAEVGNFGHRSLAVDVNTPLSESGRTAFRINALATNDRDPTDHVWRHDRWVAPSLSLDFGANTDFVLFGTYSRSTWMRQQGTSPYGTLLPNPNGTVSTRMFTGDPSFGGYDIEQYTLGYNLQHRFANGLTLRQNVRYEQEKGTGNFVSLQALRADRRTQNRQASRQWMDYDLLATDTSVLGTVETGGMTHQVVVGLDARTGSSEQKNRRCRIGALDLFTPRYGMAPTCPDTYTRHSPSRLTAVGLYAQDRISIGRDWTLVGGLRQEHSHTHLDNRLTGVIMRQTDNATTGSVGTVYEFMPSWSAYVSYSRSFNPQVGQDVNGRDFDPETGQQWEVGVKHVRDGRSASLALYDLRRQNVLISDPNNTGFSVQTGRQRARGVELEGGMDLRGGWKVSAAYAYTDARVIEDSNAALVGRAVEMTARHYGVVWADWRLPWISDVTVGLGGRYVGTQEGSDVPFRLPAYKVADLSVSYTASDYKVTVGVKNVFDRKYYDGAINANVISPGMPRTYLLTLKYMF